MNANTIAGVYNLTLGNVTSETAFPAVNPLGANSATIRAYAGLANDVPAAAPNAGSFSGQAAGVNIAGPFDGHAFGIRAAAKVTTGASSTFQLKVYANLGGNTNLTTFTNDVSIMTSGTPTIATTTNTVFLSGILTWDTIAKALSGYYAVQAANTFTTWATITNSPVTSVTLPFSFFATALFGTSNASNAVTLTELSIERI